MPHVDVFTVDNIFILHGLISPMLNQGKKLFCAFIDFTMAFDYVVRDNLWFKLIKLGIRGNILNIIKSMYETVKSKVRFENQLSEEFSCVCWESGKVNVYHLSYSQCF